MNLEKIVNKAFKEARRKISNSELASRCMEYNYPVELQLSVIRENFMDSFVIYSLKLLQEKHRKYECPDSKQYLELIYDALKKNGARILDFHQTYIYTIINFGNLNYEISNHQQNGVQLSTHNKKYSLKLCAEPNIVAKLLAMIHEYPIDNAFYEEIFRESCALYRIQEIMESSVHKLVDDLLGEDFYSFRLELCGTERFKIMLFKGVYLMDAIYTDLQHVREDVHKAITSYSNDPTHDEMLDPSWYVM